MDDEHNEDDDELSNKHLQNETQTCHDLDIFHTFTPHDCVSSEIVLHHSRHINVNQFLSQFSLSPHKK